MTPLHPHHSYIPSPASPGYSYSLYHVCLPARRSAWSHPSPAGLGTEISHLALLEAPIPPVSTLTGAVLASLGGLQGHVPPPRDGKEQLGWVSADLRALTVTFCRDTQQSPYVLVPPALHTLPPPPPQVKHTTAKPSPSSPQTRQDSQQPPPARRHLSRLRGAHPQPIATPSHTLQSLPGVQSKPVPTPDPRLGQDKPSANTSGCCETANKDVVVVF